MSLAEMLRTRPAVEVLAAIRDRVKAVAARPEPLPPAVDPWPHAWPYASPLHAPTVHLLLIGATS